MDTKSNGFLQGKLLIAMPGMTDPNFSKTVTLICEHSDEGAIGLIINQPMPLKTREVFEQLDMPIAEDFTNQAILSGGPVSVERGFILHRANKEQWQSSLNIGNGMSVTTSEDIMRAMALNQAPSGATLVLGYAGWGAGQLENELLDNAWLTVDASQTVIFDTPYEDRLELAARNAGIDYQKMSPVSGHA